MSDAASIDERTSRADLSGHVVPLGRFEGSERRCRVLVVFGTRPELIKLLPVIRAASRHGSIDLKVAATSQHTDLVDELIQRWDVPVDFNLDVMQPGQTLNELLSKVIKGMDDVLTSAAPDLVVVQGDTTTALGATMAAWQRQVPVAHVEAGLRTSTIDSPFPEEANRRLIGRLASLHYPPTQRGAETLMAEGVRKENIVVSGNTVVDAVRLIHQNEAPSSEMKALLNRLTKQRLVVFTLHRREGFGEVLVERMKVLRRFVASRPDVSVVFPVHPNPNVQRAAGDLLGDVNRIHLVQPLSYPDFLHCLAQSWAIVSDSGGIQEEAPTFGKPLLILRPETERAEAVECGVARLVGGSIAEFSDALEELDRPNSWASSVTATNNPFGDGHAAHRIVDSIASWHSAQFAQVQKEAVS